MKQIDYYRKVVELAGQNQDAEIIVCATSDGVLEDYAWIKHHIRDVRLEWVFEDDAAIHVGIPDIKDAMEEYDGQKVGDDEAKFRSKLAILVETEPY